MGRTYNKPLADDELRRELESRATIFFEWTSIRWQDIERQVERIGFGDSYIVGTTQRTGDVSSRVSLKPEWRSAL